MYTDPIADLLTRIRNASMAGKLEADVPYSSVKEHIVDVLERYDFIDSYTVEGEGRSKKIVIALAYDEEGKPRISMIKRVSKPSLRKYVKAKDVGFVRGGYGIGILSTSEGVMSDQEAKKKGLGGEYIAVVW